MLIAISVCVLQEAPAAEQPLSPTDCFFEAQRAKALFERKQYEQALPLIQKLTAHYGDDSSAWNAAAIAATETGRLEQALDAAAARARISLASPPDGSSCPIAAPE